MTLPAYTDELSDASRARRIAITSGPRETSRRPRETGQSYEAAGNDAQHDTKKTGMIRLIDLAISPAATCSSVARRRR
jgi:hypothetical protein